MVVKVLFCLAILAAGKILSMIYEDDERSDPGLHWIIGALTGLLTYIVIL